MLLHELDMRTLLKNTCYAYGLRGKSNACICLKDLRNG